jgi:hypothetical protein
MNKFYVIVFCLLISTPIYAQEADTISNNELEALDAYSNEHMLFIGISYNSNNTKNQNFNDTKLPTLLGDLSFYHNSGLYSSLVYTHYIDAKSTYETEIQLGYNNTFFDLLNLDFYYGWRSFNGDTDYESIDYEHIFSFSSGIDYEFLTFSVDQSYMIGSSNNYFLDLDAGFTFDIESIFSKNDFFNISPFVSISYGTDYWIFDQMMPRHRDVVYNYLDRQGISHNTFEYQSLNFYFPIMYSIDNFSFVLSGMYSIPSQKFKKLDWGDQYAFMLSFIYSPNL